uniref:Ig-like domain-containing protein n=2 Tax=Leptobrachium leishanense TaxID=445787 RepID=A0A8C5WF47_9ANUR
MWCSRAGCRAGCRWLSGWVSLVVGLGVAGCRAGCRFVRVGVAGRGGTGAWWEFHAGDGVSLAWVLPDTIKLTAGKHGRHSNTIAVTQGGSFELTCLAATTAASEQTHLALTWERRDTNGASPVLTVTYHGHLQPGEEYLARYSSGDVRVMYMGDYKYVLTVGAVQPSDAGVYSCVAASWVQASGRWEKIQEKSLTVAHVNVRPVGLTVKVPVSEVQVGEGLPLNLSCLVSQESAGPVLTRVRWSFNAGSSQETRELLGVQDPDPDAQDVGAHQLVVPQVWDNGTFSCRATLWALLSNGSWYPAVEAASDPITVLVVPSVPAVVVSLNASVLPLFSEEPTELLCHVSGLDGGRLSVSWYHTPPALSGSARIRLLASLDQDWTLHVGEGYEERLERGELIVSRKDPQTFALRIQWTTEADRGDYHCVSTAWKRRPEGSWVPSVEVASNPINIFLKGEEPALAVNAQLMKLALAPGGTFEMICSVSAKNIRSPQYSVTVEKPASLSPGPAQVILLSRDGQIQRQPDGNTMLEMIKEGVYRFRLYQAQLQDAGDYRCSVTAWTQGGDGFWRDAARQESDPLTLEFQSSGPVFNVTAYTDSTSVYLGDRAEFWCIITVDGPAVDPEDVVFEVSWFAQQPGGPAVSLVTVDRMAQVRHSRRNGTSEVALERISDMEFRLRIYNCEERDARGHYCAVTPWLRSGEGGWNQQAAVTSNLVPISIRMDLLSAFKYPLLIGAAVSLLAGCLACLIGYCSVRLCCKTPPKQDTRREHRRLMSMEMD